MSVKEELRQFLEEHKEDSRVWEVLADVMKRFQAGESMESIAVSYGVNLQEVTA